MIGTPAKSPRRRRKKREALGRQAWIEAARCALIEEGTAGVEVNKLAKRLGVTRGGFYWFFGSREQLLEELLAYWNDTSTLLFERLLQPGARSGEEAFRALVDLWVNEREYDPKWDAAVRDWARTSSAVLRVVRTVDNKRIAILERMFLNMGYPQLEAHVRARIAYYHQVGYYALGIRESRKQRLELLPYYSKVLTGRAP